MSNHGNVLSDRDANSHLKASDPAEQDSKPKTLEYHRQMLANKLQEEPEPKYVSPSDEIMSPATQKLKAFRTKHAMKKYGYIHSNRGSKPQTLFKKTSTKNFEASNGGGPMFADIKKDTPAPTAEEEDDKMQE
ncbi:hypothetical protein M011DRAFT_474742 [Sporormia fimetaria CBS 119925]|uniref:Uncharacterized protein n=1 Tax=Sporormia fimetaria CBS 119925 TaxID=1340428 RepID=A0A6A6VJH4_9PLEO|nr:hypothetical protein M011DRAFT_474742 [Sporormia fimetaria CBS 119925]